MKHAPHFALFLFALFTLLGLFPTASALSADITANASPANRILHVYTWADYFSPDAINLFEQAHNCHVDFTYYDSNDTMITTVRGGDGYDLITPMPTAVRHFIEEGILRPLDHALIPNLKNIDPKTPALDHDPDMRYSVPYTLTITGVGYNRKKIPEDAIKSWKIFADPRLEKKLAMLNDLRETLGAALKELGYSLNATKREEIEAAGRLLKSWKNNLAAFDVDRAKVSLQNGEFYAIQGYNGDIALIMSENPDIAFFIPETGTSLNADTFVIPADADAVPLAHAFINHFLDPAIAAMNMEYTKYYMPNPSALAMLPEEIRNNPCYTIPPHILGKCEMVHDLGESEEIYEQVWDDVLIGD